MIGYGESIIYGILQGLTEFIPVSSTAHVKIGSAVFGLKDPGVAYSAVIQLGTLLALIIFFWKDLSSFTVAAIQGIFKGEPFSDPNARMAWYLVIGTVPISVVGLLVSGYLEDVRSLYVIATSLITLALILWLVDKLSARDREIDSAGWLDFLWIGLAQCIALIPGSSRAGTTLTMGLIRGFTREAAMRASFLLSVPAIGLSGGYELVKEWEHLGEQGFLSLFIGTLVSGVVGYLTIATLLKYLRTHTTLVFVLYRIILGVTLLVLLYNGILEG